MVSRQFVILDIHMNKFIDCSPVSLGFMKQTNLRTPMPKKKLKNDFARSTLSN